MPPAKEIVRPQRLVTARPGQASRIAIEALGADDDVHLHAGG